MKMLRWIVAFVLLASGAFAQGIRGNGGGIAGNHSGTGCPLAGCTYTGPITTAGISDSGGINSTASTGYQLNGQPAVKFTAPGSGSAPGVLSGPYAGAAMDSRSQFVTGYGAYVFESLSGYPTVSEATCAGMGACIALTTGGSITAVGAGAASGETTAQGVAAFGDTTMRDVWDNGGDAIFGTGSYVDGAGGDEVVVGGNSLLGNAGTITIGGTITTGDQLAFTMTSAHSCNGTTITVNCTTGAPQTITYTVVSGDTTLTLLAAHIATAISATSLGYTLGDGANEAAHNLYGIGWQIWDPTNHPTVLKGHFPSRYQITVAYSCTGTCGETATITAAMSGLHNTLVGNNILGYFGSTTPTSNAIVGSNSFAAYATTVSYNSTLGYNIAPNATTASYNDASGYDALFDCITCSFDVVHGAYAGYQMTGSSNTVVGDETIAGSACITSGSGNLELAAGACVASPTASYQMSLQNAIYGASNSGTGSTLSTGCIGFYTTGCSGAAVAFGVPTVGPVYTVSTLPTGQTYMRAFVSDATACSFGSTPSGSGSTKCPVWYNGSAWIAGG